MPEPTQSSPWSPEVAAFLQKVESFAESLEPSESAALRRLIIAGMMADEDVIAVVNGDTAGYLQAPAYNVSPLYGIQPPTIVRQIPTRQGPLAPVGSYDRTLEGPWWFIS